MKTPEITFVKGVDIYVDNVKLPELPGVCSYAVVPKNDETIRTEEDAKVTANNVMFSPLDVDPDNTFTTPVFRFVSPNASTTNWQDPVLAFAKAICCETVHVFDCVTGGDAGYDVFVAFSTNWEEKLDPSPPEPLFQPFDVTASQLEGMSEQINALVEKNKDVMDPSREDIDLHEKLVTDRGNLYRAGVPKEKRDEMKKRLFRLNGPIYFVNAFENPDDKGWRRNRVWGWYKSRFEAIVAVTFNYTDMNEAGYYPLIVIEEVDEGILPITRKDKRWWFKYDREKNEYLPSEEPPGFEMTVNLSIG